MQVWLTLDRIDGGSTTKGPIHSDELDLTGLLFYLNRADIAGVTFTRANPLQKLAALKTWKCSYCGVDNPIGNESCHHCRGT